jgi:flagellar M-ring protein FliF
MLTPQQVQSIAYMTAFSVEGLAVENITIVDTRGTLLSGKSARNDMAGLSSTQLEVQRSVESELERKALGLLENTLGVNRAQVSVTVKLNWNRVERTIENYDADRAATLSEERQESRGEGNGAGAGPTSSERSVTNYQVPRTVEKFVPEVGNIEHISASVLVDGDYKTTKGADGTETRQYVERTPQDLEKFKSLVAGAIGIDRKRNDELTVISFPMAQEEPMPTKNVKLPWTQLLEKGLLALALIGLFLLLRSLITRMGKTVPQLPAVQMQGALAPGAGQAQLPSGGRAPALTPGQVAAEAQATAAQLREGPAAAKTPKGEGNKIVFKETPQTFVVEDEGPSVEVLKHQELLKRTTEYIVEKPDNATQILRSWILDESPEKQHR